MTAIRPDGWALDDNPVNRERFTRPKRGETELVSFRCSSLNMRKLDEIVHMNVDPRLKTKSDCLQDAVALWIEDFFREYADGVTGRLLTEHHLELVQRQSEGRQRYLDLNDEVTELAKREQDVKTLNMINVQLQQELARSEGYSPESYLNELRHRIADMERLLANWQ